MDEIYILCPTCHGQRGACGTCEDIGYILRPAEPMVKEADPELERLLAEEEDIELIAKQPAKFLRIVHYLGDEAISSIIVPDDDYNRNYLEVSKIDMERASHPLASLVWQELQVVGSTHVQRPTNPLSLKDIL